jgi:diguanylate cyclase (GGDEF)-like protein
MGKNRRPTVAGARGLGKGGAMEQIEHRQDEEAARLEALRRYDILDTPAEPKFDRIVRMASRLLDMPISLVSLIDEARQWFKAKVGLEAEETPRSVSFCTHAIQEDRVMIVEDATRDPRFAQNPLVIDDPGIRFYAGAPLSTDEGYKLGTLCVIDRVPRRLTAEQCVLLEDLAGLVVDEMELRRANAKLVQLATTDPMTGLWNRRQFFAMAEMQWQHAQRYGRPLSLLMLDIDHFKSVNDRYGHDVGDRVILHVADLCGSQKRISDIAARLGGEEFAILMPETDVSGAGDFAERLRETIARSAVRHGDNGITVTVSIGIGDGDAVASLGDLLKHADAALYEAKEAGRNRVRRSAKPLQPHSAGR